MRRFFIIISAAIVAAVLIRLIPFYYSCRELSDDVLRVHIIADSNSAADQSLKLAVRDRIVNDCASYYDDCDDKLSALRITRAHLHEIEDIARDEIRSRGFDYPVSAVVSESYFNTRYYDSFTMPAGWYDALRLTIGSGKGDNWWCVMYPTLCVGAACDDKMQDSLNDGEYRVVTSDQLDFRFRIVELFEDFINWFR